MDKYHFVLNTSQQNGIFLLICLVLVSICAIGFDQYNKSSTSQKYSIVDSMLQSNIDSLKAIKLQKVKERNNKIYPFNPNFLSEGKAYRLGLTEEEFNRLNSYRNKGKWINSAQDFKRVTLVDNQKLKQISPYFKFPEWVTKQNTIKKSKTSKQLSFKEKKDLNTVTASDLTQINGIGQKLALRIINYRNKIGEFRSDKQLKDVYGLSNAVMDRLSTEITVKQIINTTKIDINQATVIELSEVPYFNYELAREIYSFVQLREGIESFTELSKIQEFPMYKIDRIQLYLYIQK